MQPFPGIVIWEQPSADRVVLEAGGQYRDDCVRVRFVGANDFCGMRLHAFSTCEYEVWPPVCSLRYATGDWLPAAVRARVTHVEAKPMTSTASASHGARTVGLVTL